MEGKENSTRSKSWRSTNQSSYVSPSQQLQYGMNLLESTSVKETNGQEELTGNGISKKELLRTSHALGYGSTHNNYRTYLNSTNVLPNWVSQPTNSEEKKMSNK